MDALQLLLLAAAAWYGIGLVAVLILLGVVLRERLRERASLDERRGSRPPDHVAPLSTRQRPA